MLEILLGNGFSLLAMITDSISSQQKTAKRVLILQTISQAIYALSSFSLKGYSATVQNTMNIFRNIFVIFDKKSKFIEYAFLVLALVLGCLFNNLGFVGLLPIIANIEYTYAVFRFKDDEYRLKIAFFITVALFTIFNFFIYNFVGIISNSIVMVSTMQYILKTRKELRG